MSRKFERQPAICLGIFDVCCNTPKNNSDQDDPLAHRKYTGCGYQNPLKSSSGSRILLGALYFKEFPEFASTYRCGVSFIHQQVAVTAAHCLNQPGFWSILIDNNTGLYYPVAKIILHPQYNAANLQNDIALLVLASAALEAEIVCVPPPGAELTGGGGECVALTWRTNKLILSIKLPIVPNEDCVRRLQRTRLGAYFRLHASFLCAGGNHVDTCSGDGGSPLMCPVPGQPHRYHQAGIVSWGIGCGGNDIPGVYVRLSVFRDWIDGEMIKNRFDINSYRY